MNATPLLRLLLALTAATMFSLPVACRRAAAPQAATTPEAAIAPAAPSEEPMVFELRVADKAFEKRLVRGFYEVGDGWRWTARSFALSLDVPPPVDAPTEVEMDF